MERIRKNKIYKNETEVQNPREQTDTVKTTKVNSNKEFSQDTLQTVKKLCMLGFTCKRLAEFFDVSQSAIRNWRQVNAAFNQAVKDGGDLADGEVAHSLYKNALGYQEEVTEPFKLKGEGGLDYIEMVTYVKKFKPDVNAQKLWLVSRQRDLWAEKKESTHNIYTHNQKVDDIHLEGYTAEQQKMINSTLSQVLNK